MNTMHETTTEKETVQAVEASLPAVAKETTIEPAPKKKLERKEPVAKVPETKPVVKVTTAKPEAKKPEAKKEASAKIVAEKKPAEKKVEAPKKASQAKKTVANKPETKKTVPVPAKNALEAKKPVVKAKIAPAPKKTAEAPKKALVKKPAIPTPSKNGIPTKGSGKMSQLICDLLLEKQFTDEEIIAKVLKKHPEKRVDLIIVNHYRRLVNAEGKKVEKLFKVKGKGLVPKNKLTIEEKHALGVRK